LLKKETQFSRNNLSLLSPIDSKLALWVAYIKMQLWVAIKISGSKVNATFFCSRTKLQNWDW
jgi:hypothetical protein